MNHSLRTIALLGLPLVLTAACLDDGNTTDGSEPGSFGHAPAGSVVSNPAGADSPAMPGGAGSDPGSGAEPVQPGQGGVVLSPCVPFCTGMACGSEDGCGGTCTDGCDCVPSCGPSDCGTDDGCGGSCDDGCDDCTPSCWPFDCGTDDGCGGSCDDGC